MKQQYKSYEQTCEFLRQCVQQYSDIITIQSIGKTWENRDIMLATISLNVENADNKGYYPFFTSGDNILSHSEYLTDGENLFVGDGGVANINYYNGKASYSNHVWSIKPKNEILTKYLYYYILKDLEKIDFKYFHVNIM